MAYKSLKEIMKRLSFLCMLLLAMSLNCVSKDFEIVDTCIKRSEIFEIVKKWTITTLDTYDATILYEDKPSGNIIIKGKYQHKENHLTARILKYVIPYVTFQIEVQCDDGKVVGNLRKVGYSYEVLNQDSYGLNDHGLYTIIRELETIRNIMIDKGEEWIIDDSFENEYKELKALRNDAFHKKDDKSIPRSERKRWKDYYENKRIKVKLDIYGYAVEAKSDAEKILQEKVDGSLYNVVNEYIKRK